MTIRCLPNRRSRRGALIAFSLFLFCISLRAAHWDYFSCREWIEHQCATDTTPQDERLFVGRDASPRIAKIVRFRPGIGLREIIDRTALKGKTVMVCVMRPDRIRSGPFTRHTYITVGPLDTPDFIVARLDVIWLFDDGEVIVET